MTALYGSVRLATCQLIAPDKLGIFLKIKVEESDGGKERWPSPSRRASAATMNPANFQHPELLRPHCLSYCLYEGQCPYLCFLFLFSVCARVSACVLADSSGGEVAVTFIKAEAE